MTQATMEASGLGISPDDALEALQRRLKKLIVDGWATDGIIEVCPTFDEDEFEWTATVSVAKTVEVP